MSRQVIFTLMGLSVVVALLWPVPMQAEISGDVRSIHDFIERLPAGSVVWMGFDYYLTTVTECSPGAEAVVNHLFGRDCKIVVTSTIPDSVSICQPILKHAAERHGKTYGKDYVVLGYQTGGGLFIKQFCADIQHTFPQDHFHTPVSQLPLMVPLHTVQDMAFVFTVTDNASFDDYVRNASTVWKRPVAGDMTAVMVPGAYPYIQSHQALGVIGGLRGAAEYEALMHVRGKATAGLCALSYAHILVVLLIIVSNILYFVDRKKAR